VLAKRPKHERNRTFLHKPTIHLSPLQVLRWPNPSTRITQDLLLPGVSADTRRETTRLEGSPHEVGVCERASVATAGRFAQSGQTPFSSSGMNLPYRFQHILQTPLGGSVREKFGFIAAILKRAAQPCKPFSCAKTIPVLNSLQLQRYVETYTHANDADQRSGV